MYDDLAKQLQTWIVWSLVLIGGSLVISVWRLLDGEGGFVAFLAAVQVIAFAGCARAFMRVRALRRDTRGR